MDVLFIAERLLTLDSRKSRTELLTVEWPRVAGHIVFESSIVHQT